MVLPAAGNFTPQGVETGIAAFAERLGKPVVVYVKSEGYISPAAIARLAERGLVAAVKYAIVRETPARDDYLRELLDLIDRSIVISGIGERPAIAHWRAFGLASFTSGSVGLAPRASQSLLQALKRGDWAAAERLRAAFLPFEDCRDAWNPARVLHDAVGLAGIAGMGPALPPLSNLDPERREAVRAAAVALLAFDETLARSVEHAH
jgi:dihydrodipicolinate synthase/N-acetylneuraminate lyase